MDHISSRQNALVKRFRGVAAGDAVDGAMLLDGEHLVAEALASGLQVEVAAFGEASHEALAALATALERAGARVLTVESRVLEAMSPVRHPSGVAALARRPACSLDDVFARRPPLVLMLAGIQDPGNVGAIVRTAEACGATGIVAGEGTADPFGWKALRGGMGSTFRVPVAARQPIGEALARARSGGLRILATAARGGEPLPSCDLRSGCAVLLGGEGQGLPPSLLEGADVRLSIPMRPPVESLNVAIAAALILYEAGRQRAPAPAGGRDAHVAL